MIIGHFWLHMTLSDSPGLDPQLYSTSTKMEVGNFYSRAQTYSHTPLQNGSHFEETDQPINAFIVPDLSVTGHAGYHQNVQLFS